MREQFRKQGVASQLFHEAERLAARFGGETVFNWIHPNNQRMIYFLAHHGYTELNLIEIRKKRVKKSGAKIQVGEFEFDY